MITPFHIAAAVPIKFLFPKQFSLLWFSIVNILIDIEVVYYFLTTGYPSHKFFHSIILLQNHTFVNDNLVASYSLVFQ